MARKRRILAVDDSMLVHRIYEIALKLYTTAPLEVHHAANGHEGLAKLVEVPDVSVILLDVNMPGMSGMEFLQRMRAVASLRDIPVILVSTEDHQLEVQRGLKAGAVAYLFKPFTPEQLHAELDKALFRSPGFVASP